MPVWPSSALSRRGFLGLGAGVGAAVMLGGCGSDSGTSTAAPGASAAGTEPVTVRTCVYAKNHASAALYWQRFAPANYTIEVTPVTGAIQIQDALEGGQLDFGLLGPYSTIIAASDNNLTSKIVSMIARNGVGLIGAKGNVESVADLRGKKVGVPPPGIQVLILNDILANNGMTLGQDVQAIPLAYADHVAALERGDIDAYVGTEPLCTQSIVSGKGIRLQEAEETPVGNFNTANWASAKILAERPDVVREVVKMEKAAAEYLSPGGENDRANWKELLVNQFGYTEPVYEAVLENVGAEWRFDDARVAQVEGAGQMLVRQGGITTEPDYETLYAREYWDV